MARSRKPRQQTIEATLGRSPIKVSVKKKKSRRGESNSEATSSPAAAGITPRQTRSRSDHKPALQTRRAPVDESESSVDEDEDDEEVEPAVALPVRNTPRASRIQKTASGTIASSSQPVRQDAIDDDSDEEALITPVSGNRSARKKRLIVLDDSDEEPLVSSPIKKRRLMRRKDSAPVPAVEKTSEAEPEEEAPLRSSAVKRSARKPRNEKEKARELLRRKRAGEVIHEDESSSSEEGDQRALYDSDSDSDLVALQEFDDDEEGIPDPVTVSKSKKSSKKKSPSKARKRDPDESVGSAAGESDLDDFVVEDDNAPLGVPAGLLEIPLEFTSHSHKPMKEHFRDAVEWIVQFRINPGFAEKRHELYRIAWQKLDDEVGGLAQSKFLSAAWKKDFIMALRARPEMESFEVKDLLIQNCGACGRSGHPASYQMRFIGSPYFKKFMSDRFLEPVEIDSSDSQFDEDEDEEGDEDEDGNLVQEESKSWFAGSVCHANAETAHTLIHWKMGLLNFVTEQLERSGYMSPDQLAKRQKMTPKKRHKQVDEILGKWETDGTINSLHRAFKKTIEKAREQPTSGRYARN